MAAINAATVGNLYTEWAADYHNPNGHIGKVRRYLRGDHDMPYIPKGAQSEFQALACRAVTNWLPLISDTFTKGLFVDSYSGEASTEAAPAWQHWRRNGMNARQNSVHRGVFEYGAAFVAVMPGKPVPTWRVLRSAETVAHFIDDDDEFPEYVLQRLKPTEDGAERCRTWDAEAEREWLHTGGGWSEVSATAHGQAVTPVVRFLDRLDGEARGIIAPVIVLQDRINEVSFATLIAMQYASFRQRWATGLAIPEDDDGNPVEPFEAAVNRLWVSEDDGTKFGDFAQTDISGHQALYTSTVRTLAAVSQVSPNLLTGDLMNLSADALAQLEAATQRKIDEYETIFGEKWEAVFRLSALMGGNADDAPEGARVRWRDTEARALAQTVDALGKMTQMLDVPSEGLWEKIPGVTPEDVATWRALRANSDVFGELVDTITRQAPSIDPTRSTPSAAEIATAVADPTAASASVDPAAEADADELSKRASTFGALRRGGATFESAAQEAGLAGLVDSGGTPVTIRLKDDA